MPIGAFIGAVTDTFCALFSAAVGEAFKGSVRQ